MHNSLDPVLAVRDLKNQKIFSRLQILAYAIVFVFSLLISLWEYQFQYTDLYVHANIAADFRFNDLHTITSRLAYPMWHLLVSILYQCGISLIWASAIVCALAKTTGMILIRTLLSVFGKGKVNDSVWIPVSFVLMFITGIRIPGINNFVYRGVGSPTVWHNPTQLMVIVSMLLCIPYTVHLWCEFERRLPQNGAKTMLPWNMIFMQAVLLMFSLSCKPTFMQAMLPASAIFFAVQWIRFPRNSRYFLQIIIAFLPAAGYFLLQYLYYTGVVVPFTSGVEFGATAQSVLSSLRNVLIMNAFPIFVLIGCWRKGMFKDKMLVITLLLIVISTVEAMLFRETGIREGHGNFNWANMSSSLMLWVLMIGRFVIFFAEFWRIEKKPCIHWVFYVTAFLLLGWHLYSSGYYVGYLFGSGNSF